jgi:hypothetical protein
MNKPIKKVGLCHKELVTLGILWYTANDEQKRFVLSQFMDKMKELEFPQETKVTKTYASNGTKNGGNSQN